MNKSLNNWHTNGFSYQLFYCILGTHFVIHFTNILVMVKVKILALEESQSLIYNIRIYKKYLPS